ncbi:hypothetical protein GCM10009837_67410 [Streptomyces durmitorensis]|uniref:Uncharacterized protein n=1 Tax=Streptomyces durmitorensis TaxID=319947 RepID=A0ABY4Q674_9ACTN|nr:hypothetical protein [Streptomyces durmitorensis]UQT61226.1 hypothetical protein M4V62_42565 [Streptomyces durmitorensis]
MGRAISPKLAHSQAIGRIVNASLAVSLVPVNADVPDLDAAFINTEDPKADPS